MAGRSRPVDRGKHGLKRFPAVDAAAGRCGRPGQQEDELPPEVEEDVILGRLLALNGKRAAGIGSSA